MISVLILTLNEEVNIGDCLDSVAWTDDVLVLDSGSTDHTCAIAEQHGARVMHRPFDNFANQRNYGLNQGELKYDWVLHLDADERVTPKLHDALKRRVREGGHDAYRIPSKLMFRGRWLKHAGMYPTYQIRFGRRDALTFQQVGHGQRGHLPKDRVGTIDEPLLHYVFSKGINHWFERHTRYAAEEADHAMRVSESSFRWQGLVGEDPQRRRRVFKDLSYRLPFRPLLRFLYMYVGRGGFLDGRPGLDYCLMLAIYEYMIGLHIREKRESTGGSAGARATTKRKPEGNKEMPPG